MPLVIIALSMMTLFAVVAGYQVALIVLPFGFAALLVLVHHDSKPAERFVALIAGVGLALTFFVEVLVLNWGDVSRMNTVFKFYLQAWVLLGIAAAVSVIWVSRRFADAVSSATSPNIDTPDTNADDGTRSNLPSGGALNPSGTTASGYDPTRGLWRAWKIVLLLLVAATALYPILATRAKIYDRWARQVGPGLDSLEWMKNVTDVQEGLSFPLLWDYEALMWLRDNIDGSPVVVEGAKAQPYRSLRGRVATYTGLPIVIGYPWHQKQQRSFLKVDLIGQRERDVNNLYETTDPWLASEILDRYDVSLVYVGDLERALYSHAGIEKFDQMENMGLLQRIYANEGVIIYRVVRNSP
jgi:uncharacterized membrane protein